MTLGQFSVIFGVFNLNKMYKYILSDCGQFNYYILLLQKKSLWTSHKPPSSHHPPDERKRDYICFVIIYRLCGSTGWCHRHQVRLWFYFLGGGMADNLFIVTVGHCHMICDEYSVINQLANWNLLCSHLSWCKNILHLLLLLHLLLYPKAKELMPFGDHTKQYNHHRMKKMLFIPWVILGSCIRDTCKVMPFPASSCLF